MIITPLFTLAIAVEQLDWFSYIERAGFPMAALLALVFALWRTFKFFAPKVVGWVERWVAAHEERSKAMSAAAEKSVEIQHSNAVTLRTCAETIQAIDKKTSNFQCGYRGGTGPSRREGG